MDLSIVIPAFNEAHKIGRDVEAAGAFLQAQGLSGQVIVADDGSGDGTVAAARAGLVPAGIELKVLALPHRGKGNTVREGIKASAGDYVMFADSGLCVPFTDVLRGLEMLRGGQCEIANGSRKMSSSVIERPQSLYRRILSRCFRWAVLRYFRLPSELTDTQCGFKVYRGDVARQVYGACIADGFMFDLEVLMRARSRGYRIREFPVDWTCDRDSRLKPSRVLLGMMGELREIKKQIDGNKEPKL